MFQLQLFFLLHCDEWDRVVALPRYKFVTGATLLQLIMKTASHSFRQKLSNIISVICDCSQEYNKCELSQLSPFSLSSLVVVYYKTFHNKQS